MAQASSIEWTESTWNPVTGCTKISPGCAHCYAERMALRLKAIGQPNYAHGFDLTLHENALELPLKWKKPQTIFVNSMSDLFHQAVPVEFIRKTFEVMCRADWHRYQVLTKRSDRLLELSSVLPWKPHIWMGVSVESLDYVRRIEHLRKTGAKVDWVIVGVESGPGARPMDPAWVAEIRDQCVRANVPFFFKQWGGTRKKKAGRELQGRTWDEMPALALAVTL